MLNLQSKMDLNCFKQTYQDARLAFKHALKLIDPELIFESQSFQHPLTDSDAKNLFCDAVFLSQSAKPKHVLVLICGTHGIEGFTGSAVQIDTLPLLADLLKQQADLGVVLIHALNPWGFAWLRRSDHQGIDLNRNFIDFSQPLPSNPDYQTLHTQLQGLTADSDLTCLWENTDFNTFVAKITQGQYQQADGLFYGGTQASWSQQQLNKIAQHAFIQNAEQLSVIDVHTGLGPYGYGEIINDHTPNTAGFAWAETLYGNNACSALLGESCSAPKLGLLDYFWHDLMGGRGCFITLEYGTFAVQHLILELLKEQLYQNQLKADQQRDLQAKPVVDLKNFFYPFEPSWQQQVLFRARQTIAMALTGMLKGLSQ
ncbi:hypothetical protein THMIRHAM_20520 [Thiomicrorhabdus immobilis]|uniref:DUF2817 domain-containing protein n=1 Tax=Thiomicrorhabdus immobilis TaxID=2791037 RepID=A0ABM7MFM2_9GAMM|nr:DUF2817 domain-containing protein [Thiomicrorhabdus immobilis]BCN94267.1 hypothetical protein THMIRHAM_20520 [Thiomicrorhabdus immobilis]